MCWVKVMRLQVSFVNKVHDNTMRKPPVVLTPVFPCRDGNDTRDSLLKRTDTLKESFKLFTGSLGFGLEQDDMRNHAAESGKETSAYSAVVCGTGMGS